MGFVPLDIPPGVVKTRSGEGAAGRWNDANNVRFVAGKPRKRAGHEQVNTLILDGKARGMRMWNKTTGAGLYAIGTNTKLYGSIDGVDVINITPLRFVTKWVNQLTTLLNKGAVSVQMNAHGFVLGKRFIIYGNSFQGGSLAGGLLLNGIWELVSVTDANNFKIYPIAASGALGANPFSMTNASPIVTVTHAGHGRQTGDAVWFDGAVAGGGITIAGDYQITVVNVNSYTITHTSNATSTTTGGGAAVTYKYGKAATSAVAAGGGTVPYYEYQTNPFATTVGLKTVTVTHANHGAMLGDTVIVSGSAAVGGITPAGAYLISSIIGANSYTFEHSIAAAATTTGGGAAVLLEYEISIGPADKIAASLRGFGMGTLGSGFFGASGPADNSTYYDPRTWAIDHNGEDGLMCPLGGTVYYWDSSVGGRADAIPNAPTGLRYSFMTEERFLHFLGINGDPLLFGWASQDNINDTVSTATNTANSGRRVREGSALIAGCPVGGGFNLLWTDTAVYTHQFTGSKFIYDTRLGVTEAGLIAPMAFARTPKGVLWMSQTRFKMWAGSTMDIPNAKDIETWVYENLDPEQKGKSFAAYDAINNTVDFYFVPLGGSEPSLYVSVNLDDFSWVNGIQTRTTGASFDAGKKFPYRVNEGKVFKHEVGVDADGVSAASSLSMAPFEMKPDEQEFLGFDPNFKRLVGDMELTVTSYDRDESDVEDVETETVSSGASIIDFRSAGRHVSFTLSQDVLGGDWSLDTPQIDIKKGARRR